MKTLRPFLMATFILATTTACVGGSMESQINSEEITYTLPENPNFGSNVSVHDPSVFKDANGDYYTFGSHFAVTKSTDMMHWQQISSDGGWNNLYARDWKLVLADAFAHLNANPGSTWAPAVHLLGGKYYMYYSLSTFGSSVSYIGRVEADSATGPYDNSVEIVKSDGRGGPNAIDPELFFDKDGKLWLVYGSFFAGIYIKELYSEGENIGLPKETGYGTLLWQGSSNGPEGPFIFYNEETEYYYLMASHGSLFTNYNMRVARSANPDGPYLDPNGYDVSIMRDAGVKLAGNYQFDDYPTGYAALGHNSVLKEDGKYLVVYHTRYRQGQSDVSGYHNQFVNQLFFNKLGWPVLAPNRYAGETIEPISIVQAAKTYDVLIHTGGDSEGFAGSARYIFEADGNILDDEREQVGTWSVENDYDVTVRIGLNTFVGVVVPQWINDRQAAGLSITAYSRNGLSLWANEHIE